jgi:hypothetical protein
MSEGAFLYALGLYAPGLYAPGLYAPGQTLLSGAEVYLVPLRTDKDARIEPIYAGANDILKALIGSNG